jgi:YhcH/YjgK/YiaL family protein
MIYDKLDNIEIYRGLSDDIYEGLKFLKQATSIVVAGVYQLNPRVKAIVSEYQTRFVNENGYEAHRKSIDVHYLLSGVERIRFAPIQHLRTMNEYCDETDCVFFSKETPGSDFIIGNGFFLILFPDDGHMPQLCVDSPERIMKITLKVLMK